MKQSTCLKCQKQFSYKQRLTRANPVAKFCTIICRHQWQKENRVRYDKICAECNRSIQAKDKRTKFCNEECKIKNVGGYRPKKECFTCKNIFSVKGRNDREKQSVYCSRTCRYKIESDPVYQFNRMKRHFEKNVVKSEHGCWLWMGAQRGNGYGQTSLNRKPLPASRASWLIHYGEIPEGMFVCHSCDVRACVSPAHLWLGTPKDNTQDMIKKGRKISPQGEDAPHTKIKTRDVINIKSMIKQGIPVKEISNKLSISHSIIYGIRNGRTWKHVE
jgi:hypothetical protein